MSEEYTAEDLDELESQLDKCLEAYELGEPLILDDQYDHYKRILQKLRPNAEFLKKIGNKPKKNIETLPYILGSLRNKFEDDIQAWLDKHDNGSGFVLSHKLDGVAVETRYINCELTGAWLRGDHYEGENITAKALKFIPNKIEAHVDSLGDRYFKGEALLGVEPGSIKRDDGTPYKTKRNAAAGILNADNHDRLKYIYIIFHTAVFSSDSTYSMGMSELDRIFFMQNIFPQQNVVVSKYVKTKEEVIPMAKKLMEMETQYDKDGIVVTVNKSEVENIKLPEKKIAFKFNKMAAETECIKIEWNTSRTGNIVPVVVMKPVTLGEATIQRASGFHAKYIYENGIGPGAILKIVRSGDVIPYIESVIKPGAGDYPSVCPSCGKGPLEADETETHLCCRNIECPAQIEKKIAYFFEKLGLENFSEKMISTLNCWNIIDIYELKKEDILKIDGWAETSATDFLNRIEETKKARPEKILAALGIDNLGVTTSKLILEHLTLQDILVALNNPKLMKDIIIKLMNIKGIGEKTVKSIVVGLNKNKVLLENFMSYRNELPENNGPLKGKSFCITGSLSKPRKVFEQLIEKYGGSNTSISSCNYLICNTPSDSNKFKKAIDKGVKVITEKELIEMIKGNMK